MVVIMSEHAPMLTNRVPLGSRKAVSVASGTSSWANAPFSFGLSGAKKHQVDAEIEQLFRDARANAACRALGILYRTNRFAEQFKGFCSARQ